MREVLDDIERWAAAGKRVALAQVVSVVGSAPRAVGAALAVSDAGDISGSVSGGCVEPDVIEQAQAIFRAARPGARTVGPGARLLTYGVSEEENFERIGLSCGGEIQVFVRALDPEDWRALAKAIRAGQPVIQATNITGGPELLGLSATWVGSDLTLADGSLGSSTFDDPASEIAREVLRQGASGIRSIPTASEGEQPLQVFFASYPPQPTLIVIGAGHITIPLTRIARVLGYRTVVIDAREAFATRERLPDADEIIVSWPDEALGRLPLNSATAIAVLTHDDKFDVPALTVALNAPDVGYVGAIGSRGTRAKRDERLRANGITEEQIARIHGPIGLNIGAGSPEEIALAIMAEITAVRHGKA
jgi:xanthine dehydrogenase accessory factor